MNKGVDSQDIAKGIMIFLAVMMHTVRAEDVPMWRVAISSFHVPLFFIVSGVVIRRAKAGWWAYIRNNALALLLPYLVWTLIYTPFRLEFLPWVFYGSWAALNRIGANTALWFLPALFCARLMFEAIMRLIDRISNRRLTVVFAAAAVSFGVGMTLPHTPMGYPLGLNCAILALGFLLIGSVVGDCLKTAERWRLSGLACIALVTMALFAYGAFLRPGEHNLVGIAELRFGSRFWFFWNVMFGCAVVLSCSVILSFLPAKGAVSGPIRRFLVWLGRNTIGVLILHVPIVRLLAVPCLRKCGLFGLDWYVALANAGVALAISCLLIWMAQQFTPMLCALLGLKAEKPL